MTDTYLLDANVLIALLVRSHAHHEAARRWLADVETVAVCPVAEGALVRYLVRTGESPALPTALLAEVHANRRFTWWPDDLSYKDLALTGIVGHRQVTDTYLVQLAARHGARLATFDRALAARHPDGALLIPEDVEG